MGKLLTNKFKKKITVLVVGPDPDFLETVNQTLMDTKCVSNSILAGRSSEALNKMANQVFEVIVIDIDNFYAQGSSMLEVVRGQSEAKKAHTIVISSGTKSKVDTMIDDLPYNTFVSKDQISDINKLLTDLTSPPTTKKAKTNQVTYCKVPLTLIRKIDRDLPFDIFVKIGQAKYIKLRKAKDDISEDIHKFENKGIRNVFVERKSFQHFLLEMKKRLLASNHDEHASIQEQVATLEESMEMIKEQIAQFGINDLAIEMAEEVTKGAQKIIRQAPNIFKFFDQFKKNCADEFLDTMLTNYTVSAIMNGLSWNSGKEQEKVSLATLLSDVVLSEKEFKEIREYKDDPEELSPKSYNHPQMVSQLLLKEKRDISNDIITIIEQHHERPDGSGFPRKLKAHNISMLAAVNIIAQELAFLLKKFNFDYSEKNKILKELHGQFHEGHFKKIMTSLDEQLKSSSH